MLDALTEVSRLHVSQSLQNRDTTLVSAHKLIEQTIKALENMIDSPGKYQSEISCAVEDGVFKGIRLNSSSRTVEINSRQFFRSLANSVGTRMMTVISRRG
jgi:F0F1-type ATP synthase delta subunit